MTTFVTLSTMAPRALKRTFTVLAASILTLSIIAPKGA
jgi:hypothetical protein